MNPLDWIPGLCDRLAIVPTDTITTALSQWAASEGMPDSANNTLATTDKITGSKTYNSAGVQTYPSISAMNDLYARKLLSGTYASIASALASGDLTEIYHAINNSPWCPDCQGGDYPVQLYQFLVATGALPGAKFIQIFNNVPGQSGPAPEAWNDAIAVGRLNLRIVALDSATHERNFGTLRY